MSSHLGNNGKDYRAAATALLIAVAAATGLGGKGTPPPEIFRGEPPQPGTPPFHALNGLPRHSERFAPFSVQWLTVAVGRGFRRVYPHPILPDRVVVVARGGLFLSEDCGRTWRTLDKGGATLGDVLDLAFSPAVPDEFAVATSEKGVWLTSDAGRSFRRIGSRSQGMAADRAVCVVYDIHNPRFDSLLVGHGEGGAGMSRTYDGGRTWQVLYPAFEFYRIGPRHWQSRAGFLVDVVDRKKGDAHRLYRCVNLGEILEEMKADALPADLATSRVLRGSSNRPANEELGASWKYLDAPVFVATEDDGVYRLDNSGLMRCGPSYARSFGSLDVTYGRHADQQYLLAYAPREGGLWVTTDARTSWYWNDIIGINGMGPLSKQYLVKDYEAEWTAVDDGIAVGNGVQSGAHIRANAGGTRLYAVANGMLRVGTVDTGPCVISRVKITPPVLWVRPREIGTRGADNKPQGTVPAAMFCRPGDYGEAPSVGGVKGARDWVSLTDILVTVETAPSGARARYVTVDLSRLGGESLVLLHDDGAHEDGAAGDGVFAARCAVDPQALCHTSLDGRVVWSQTEEQNVAEAIEARGIAGSDEVGNYDRGSDWRVTCGQVGLTARAVSEDGEVSGAVGVLGLHPLISRVVLSRATEMTLFAGSDSWCPVRQGPGPEKTADVCLSQANVEGMDFLRFEIKAEGAAFAGDVRVRLRDRPPSRQPHETAPVGLVAGGYIPAPGPNAEYVTVSIPLTDMLKSSPDFVLNYLKWVSISAEGGVYKVRNLRLETASGNGPLTLDRKSGDGVITMRDPDNPTNTVNGLVSDGKLSAKSTVGVTVTAALPGLKGEYFNNKTLTGDPVLTRTDGTVDFAWGGAPDPALPADNFSVRWTGSVLADYSGTYTFYVTGDDGVRLWVNSQQLVDQWKDQGPTEYSGTIELSAGRKYDVKLEYYESGGGAEARLKWSHASVPKAVIPQDHLVIGP